MNEAVVTSKEEKLLDFKVVNEEWSQYELEDGSLLKMKLVLVNILQKAPVGKKTYEGLFSSENVIGVHSPKRLRGPPGRKYTVDELKKHIIERNLKFRQTVDGGWNEYETGNTIIQFRNVLKSVDKTSLFDSAGMCSYLVNLETMVISKPKTKTTRRKRKKRRR